VTFSSGWVRSPKRTQPSPPKLVSGSPGDAEAGLATTTDVTTAAAASTDAIEPRER